MSRPGFGAAAVLLNALWMLGCAVNQGATGVNANPVVPREVSSLAELNSVFDELSPDRSLVVFDLDNTLLKMRGDLGSVAWWDWQQMLGAEPGTQAGEIENELAVQGILYATRDMAPTEPLVRELIQRLQDRGIDVMILTARGPDFRDATLAQMRRVGRLRTIADCGPPLCPRRGTLDYEHVRTVAEDLLGAAPVERLQMKSGRPLSSAEGVVMVAGQRKGLILALLLQSLPKRYGTVIAIDDDEGNVRDLEAVREHVDATLFPVHYVRYRADVQDFFASPARQRAVTAQWRRIHEALCAPPESAEWCEATRPAD